MSVQKNALMNPMYDKDWEERKIRKYMEEEQENQKQLWE